MNRVLAVALPLEVMPAQAGAPVVSRLTSALARAVFFSLLALIPLTAAPYGTVEPWWEALFESAVFLLAIFWIIERWLSGARQLTYWRLFLPLFALVIFAWLQALPFGGVTEIAGVQSTFWAAVSADPDNTRRWASKLLALIFVGLMLLSYTSSQRRLRALIVVILGTGIASALFGLLRQTVQSADGFLLPYLPLGSGYGQFINRNHFAFLMELTLGLTLGLFCGAERRRAQWPVYAAVSLPLWLGLVLANSRGGLFSMLCLALFVTLLARGAWGRKAWLLRGALALVLLLLLAAGAVWVGGDPLVNRLGTVSEGSAEISRVEVWRATWDLSAEHWLAGVGFGAYWAAIPAYHEAAGRLIPQEAHNDYLELFASGGVLGTALAVWFVVAFGRLARRRWRQGGTETRAARLGALAGLGAVAVHSSFDFGLHITINALLAVALAVIVVRSEEAAPGQAKNQPFGAGEIFERGR